jgi:hypothetical protein
LFNTNGTAAGLKKVSDLNAVRSMTAIGKNKMLMMVYRNSDRNYLDLWVTDGTASGTKLLKDFGTLYYPEIDIEVRNGKALFIIDSVLWTSDGTACGTYPTSLGTYSEKRFSIAGNFAIFSGYNSKTGFEPHAFELNQVGAAPCDATTSANAFGDSEVFGSESFIRQAPNPFQHDFSLTVSGKENETAEIEIYSLSGMSVENLTEVSCNVEHKLGNSWPTGMYVMKIKKAGAVHTEKIIKR